MLHFHKTNASTSQKIEIGRHIKCTMYLDDGIGGSSSALETVSISEKMQRDISAAGLTINREKSNLFPTREGSWLGFYY